MKKSGTGDEENRLAVNVASNVRPQCESTFLDEETEDLIKRKGAKGVSEYLQTLYGQLKDIVQLVRGKLTKMQRKVTSALCTIDVHARAVLEEMEKVGVRRADDFEWLSQLRYYWGINLTTTTGMTMKMSLIISSQGS